MSAKPVAANGALERLLTAARGGRVAHTGFLEPDAAAALSAKLREAEVGVHVSGGFPGARRRVVTAFPETIPEATTLLSAFYAEGVLEPDDLFAAFKQALGAEAVGDTVKHAAGFSIIVLGEAGKDLPGTVNVRGRNVELQEVGVERVASGSRKRSTVIVPSLRVDALGAKAFNVSRSYFSKGIAAGNVTVNGQKAGKSSSAEAGDEVYAEGLGRFSVGSVQGETRRGNLKVDLEVEKA